MVMAIDPGREKCGIAVLDDQRKVQFKAVIETNKLAETASVLVAQYKAGVIVLGNGTGSKNAQESIRVHFKDSDIRLHLIDEYRTTDMARQRYWQENPPKGWRRLLPVSMQMPPAPVDDYVAVILAEAYMSGNE